MAAAPLHDQDGARIGVVITGRISAAPFMEAKLHPLVHLVQVHSANGDVAPIAALQQRAAFEERECLAHEIPEGIAQELVALGYRIDVARRLASTPYPPTRAGSRRGVLGSEPSTHRSMPAYRRPAPSGSPDQGLGAVVGARLRQFGTTRGLTWD